MIKAGDTVIVTDAHGQEHEAKASTGVTAGRNFPVVWVRFGSDQLDAVPWPASDVREVTE